MQERLPAAILGSATSVDGLARSRPPQITPDRVRSDFLRRGLLQRFYKTSREMWDVTGSLFWLFRLIYCPDAHKAGMSLLCQL